MITLTLTVEADTPEEAARCVEALRRIKVPARLSDPRAETVRSAGRHLRAVGEGR